MFVLLLFWTWALQFLALLASAAASSEVKFTPVTGFIGRNRSRLIELDNLDETGNPQPWRFSGANAYWLGLDHNCQPPADPCTDQLAYPTKFRIDDLLLTAAGLGANVIRSQTLGVSTGNEFSLQPKAGSEFFNLTALETVDYAIYRGGSLGLRFIVPLTDNYDYYHGGYHDFVDYQITTAGLDNQTEPCNWRPKRVMELNDTCRAFFDRDAAVGVGNATIAAFKRYVSALLNHRNAYTGNLLKDEPAILAWETGNELQIKGQPFVNWTAEIATFMKEEVGIQQLVADGRDQVEWGFDDEALACDNVDIFSDHCYYDYEHATRRIRWDACITVAAGKVFTVGEYGLIRETVETLEGFTSVMERLQAIDPVTGESFPAVAGDAFWSLFGHGDLFGMVTHADGHTTHYPGADNLTQAAMLSYRQHAYHMRFGKLSIANASTVTTPSAVELTPTSMRADTVMDIDSFSSTTESGLRCVDEPNKDDYNCSDAGEDCDENWMRGFCCNACYSCADEFCRQCSGLVEATLTLSEPVPNDTHVPSGQPVVNGLCCGDAETAMTPPGGKGECSPLLTWRGVALAVTYDVQYLVQGNMSNADNDTWITICESCVKDHELPWQLNRTVFPDGFTCPVDDAFNNNSSNLSSFTTMPPGVPSTTTIGTDVDASTEAVALIVRVRGRSLLGEAGPWSNATDVCSLECDLPEECTNVSPTTDDTCEELLELDPNSCAYMNGFCCATCWGCDSSCLALNYQPYEEFTDWFLANMTCEAQNDNQLVVNVTDGGEIERCFVLDIPGVSFNTETTDTIQDNNTNASVANGTSVSITTTAATTTTTTTTTIAPAVSSSTPVATPRPVLMFAHGAQGSANHCGNNRDNEGNTLQDLAEAYGFALVCLEARQYYTVSFSTGVQNGTYDCSNISPSDDYTCKEQAAIDPGGDGDKCDKLWMEGYCCGSCFGCSQECLDLEAVRTATTPTTAVDITTNSIQCLDTPPSYEYTCAEQAAADPGGDSDRCEKDWMTGFCCASCFDCDEDCVALNYSTVNTTDDGNDNEPDDVKWQGGRWEIPQVFNSTTGTNCDLNASFDSIYLENVLQVLAAEPDMFDMSRIFLMGTSMGSAFTVWQSPCLHTRYPQAYMAFGTHSTGLKIKGDGNDWGGQHGGMDYYWGECPTCETWPTVMQSVTGLKACIFDGYQDNSDENPFFYRTSVQLAEAWSGANNSLETHWYCGGHGTVISYDDMLRCLDNNTSRLIPGGGGATNSTAQPMEECNDETTTVEPTEPTDDAWVTIYIVVGVVSGVVAVTLVVAVAVVLHKRQRGKKASTVPVRRGAKGEVVARSVTYLDQ